jgi:hypothetical protein
MTREEKARRAAVRAIAPLSKPPQMGEAFLDQLGPPSASHPSREPQAGEERESLPATSRASHFS